MNLHALSNPNDSMILWQGAAEMKGLEGKSLRMSLLSFSLTGLVPLLMFPYMATVSCGKTSYVLCKGQIKIGVYIGACACVGEQLD